MRQYLNNITAIILFFALTSCATSPKTEKQAKIGDLYLKSGTTDVLEGNYTQALQSLIKAVEYLPENDEAWNSLGLAYFGKKDFVKSEESFRKALSLNSKNNFARNNLGALYLNQNKLSEAQKEFYTVTKDLAFPEQYKTYYNLGIIEQRKKNNLRALSYFHRSIKENPSYCVSWLKIGESSLELSNKEKAESAFKSASSGICYSFTEAHYHLGLYWTQTNKTEEAKEKFSEIITRFPNTTWAKLSEAKLQTLSSRQ